MFRPFSRGARMAPSHYPRLPFHGIRFFQLVSSLVVGAIMCYFMYHLKHDHWGIPWTFIWLLTASLLSIAVLAFTIVLHCFTGLNPRLNIALNSALFVLWALSWSLLTWYMSKTLANLCDMEHWNEDAGIMVCRIYKALFTFTLVGLLSTIAALALDIYVFRQHTRRGVYRLQDLDNKRRPEATRGPFTDAAGHGEGGYGQGGLPREGGYVEGGLPREGGYGEGGLPREGGYGEGGLPAEPREGEASEISPRPSMGPYAERADPHKDQQGYAVPEGQFEYDTGYRGHEPQEK